jgi:sulfur-oxidizing protein SoxY
LGTQYLGGHFGLSFEFEFLDIMNLHPIHRRGFTQRSLILAGMLGALGLPELAFASYNKLAFEAKTVPEAVKAHQLGTLFESKDIVLTAPDYAENGAAVPLAVATSLPGVRKILVLIEKNPAALVAMFNVSDLIDANFNLRAKMSQTSDVYAVALTVDGKAFFARKEVKVTIGGCGA